MESKDYIDCIKLAISLGGDADTLAAHRRPHGLCLLQKDARCPRIPGHEKTPRMDGGCQREV